MAAKSRSVEEEPTHSGVIAYRFHGDEVQVLLVTARGSGRWIIPKGKIDEDVGSRESARREAFEEAGIEGDLEKSPFRRYLQGDDEDGDLVEVFLMRVNDEADSWPEDSERIRRWVPLDHLDGYVTDPGLRSALLTATPVISSSRRERRSKPGHAPKATIVEGTEDT